MNPKALAYELVAAFNEARTGFSEPITQADVTAMETALERALPKSLAERVALIREVTRQ